MKKETQKGFNNTIQRRKQQNTIDYFFKEYIKTHDAHLYKQAAAESNIKLERLRICKIIRKEISRYRILSKKSKNKRLYGSKILALHRILFLLDECN
jgi:hypothetical protein